MVIGLIGHYRPSNGVFMAVSPNAGELETHNLVPHPPPKTADLQAVASSLPATGAHTKQIPTNVQRTELDCLGEIPGDFLGFKGRMMLNVCLIRRLLQWESEIGNM